MKYKSGFTLWELVIVVAIIGLLANLTVPAFSALTQRRRSDVIAVQIEEMMRYARTEALRRNINVTVCGAPTSDINNTKDVDIQTASCLKNSRQWSSGIVAIIDDGSGSGNKLKAMSIESASFSSAVIVPHSGNSTGSGLFVINRDSTLKDENGKYPCFDIKQKINGKWSHLIVEYTNRYGNSVRCSKSSDSDVDPLCSCSG